MLCLMAYNSLDPAETGVAGTAAPSLITHANPTRLSDVLTSPVNTFHPVTYSVRIGRGGNCENS